ncbi:MAG: hypothetical protein GOP50_08635 [Candidatus Heimdallarchaeota archaeon]|nr:hypothetical protein [Candidatus Heimdallarchaeota archaeon]
MTKDEVKSLVNSVNMIKNMVESIVAAVQERFKDYDEVVVSLKERIQNLEDGGAPSIAQPSTQASTPGSFEQITKLEKRLDSLNERILLIEAARSVHKEAVVEPTEVQAFKDVAVKETQPEIVKMPEAPASPPPTPEIVTPEPETKPVVEEPVPPTIEAPLIPTPTPPPATRISDPEPAFTPEPTPKPIVEPVPKAPTEIPTPSVIPKPASQVTDTGERDVSPISKEVSGAIPAPPKQEEAIPTTDTFQPQVLKTDPEAVAAPEEKKSAELFGEAVSGDKAELLKALKKLEDL